MIGKINPNGEMYIARGSITKLGDTGKLGAFVKVNTAELMKMLNDLYERSGFSMDDVDNTSVLISMLPLSYPSEKHTHSVKLKIKHD